MRLYFIALALVAFVCGCTMVTPRVDCSKITDSLDSERCYYNRSVETMDVGMCGNIMDIDLSKKCINDVAITVKDYLPCKAHQRRPDRDRCELLVSDARKKTKLDKSKNDTVGV